jgi:hypothetical protein
MWQMLTGHGVFEIEDFYWYIELEYFSSLDIFNGKNTSY